MLMDEQYEVLLQSWFSFPNESLRQKNGVRLNMSNPEFIVYV